MALEQHTECVATVLPIPPHLTVDTGQSEAGTSGGWTSSAGKKWD